MLLMHVGGKMKVYRLTDASINTCFMGNPVLVSCDSFAIFVISSY